MTIGSTICVLGMHRSGTSLVAGILNILGMNLGREQHLMKPRGDNPKGFWEHQLLTDLNDEILSRFGGTWDRPPTFPQGWEISSTLDDLRQKALTIIDDDFRDAKLWGWKDPRTCLTLPFWQQLIPDMRYVLCLRNPINVSHSLKHRDGFTLDQGIGLWLQYTSSSLRLTSAKQRLIISYDDILDNRDDLIELLCNLTGNNAVSKDTFNTINGLIDHDLRHHHTTSTHDVDSSPLSFPAQALFLGLRLYTRGGGVPILPTITLDQEVQAAFDNLAVAATQAHYNRIIELNDAIAKKDQYARDLEILTAQQEQALARIYQSHGWKALLAYYKMRDLIFPPGSQRKFLAKNIFHVLLRTKKTQ